MAADRAYIERLNPGARDALATLARLNQPPLSACTAEQARRIARSNESALTSEPEPVDSVRKHEIPNDRHAIATMVYRGTDCPDNDASCIVYSHGGGWVLGHLPSHDVICRWLANAADCVVLYPDYRLAPEFKFPAALSDIVRTLEYAHQRAPELGVSRDLIGVSGDSAGGNLATVAAGVANATDRDPLVAQLLFYPNTDASFSFPSYQTYAAGYGLSTAEMMWFRDHYLGDPSLVPDERVSPLKKRDLGGHPPTHLVVAGLDILRDECIAYGEALSTAGVPTDVRILPDLIHGFVSMGNCVDEARVTVEKAAQYFTARVGEVRAKRS